MWSAEDIVIEILSAEATEMIVSIATPAGTIDILGSVTITGDVLRIEGAHAQGLSPGAIGRAGLNAIGRKMLEVADVKEIVVQGGRRTTGRRKGQVPGALRFPHP